MKQAFTILLALLFLLPMPTEAARSVTTRKALVVGKAALYGLGGGLVIGLASQVVKRRTKNIFMFGSLGMYAGIVTGLFLVATAGGNPKEYEGPDTYEDFTGWDSHLYQPPKGSQQAKIEEDKVELRLFSKNF